MDKSIKYLDLIKPIDNQSERYQLLIKYYSQFTKDELVELLTEIHLDAEKSI